jgi:hypothetical protein
VLSAVGSLASSRRRPSTPRALDGGHRHACRERGRHRAGAVGGVRVAIGAAILPLVLAHYDGRRCAPHTCSGIHTLNLVTLSLMAVLNGAQRFAQFHVLRLLVACGTGGAISASGLSTI